MTASELLSDLRERGVKLWVDGGDLRFGAPRGTLDPEVTGLLSRHKLELIGLLKSSPAGDGAPASRQKPARSHALPLDKRMIELSSLREWRADDQIPFVRYVAPYRGFLYQHLGLDKTFVRGEGCYLVDADGTRYADFIAQFGAVPFGHDPEAIWQALERVRRGSQPNLAIASISPAAGELAERLLSAAPPGLAHVVYTNSGAEAVEVAIKLARCRTGRLGILSIRNGFHGLTLAGMSATDKDFFQRGFGAPVSGFNYVTFGDLAELQTALEMRPNFFAALMIEIVQGESGMHVIPDGYLRAAFDLCRRHGVLLIVDEVQTGLGRTGRLFACEQEGVTPDIIVLAKALGGGLMPIGACLYTRDVFTEQFDLRHGSTFAGNTLACCAAIATIDELTKDDQRLVRQVAALGQRLQDQLRALQIEFPLLIKDIRGRGFMIGIELDLDHVSRTQTGLLSILQEQALLLYLVVSYLLNVEHIRIAASFTQGNVLRIEPPLVADAAMCDQLIDALRRLLSVLQAGDAGELLTHLMGKGASTATAGSETGHAKGISSKLVTARIPSENASARFAFIVHLLGDGDLRRFDPSLGAVLDDEQLNALRLRISPFIKSFPYGRLVVRSTDGGVAEGELIVLPHLPSELLALSGKEALDLVQDAIDLAGERGAEVVGLGGFSSIVAGGGLAVHPQSGMKITSGNSLTTWAAVRAVEAACAQYEVDLANATVAIVGATGAIGHALSMLFAERTAKLILIGNPNAAEASLGKLRDVAQDCERHLGGLDRPGHNMPMLAHGRIERHELRAGQTSDPQLGITITTDIDHCLPKAQVILAATNAVVPFVSSRHVGQGAIVCDVSRPFNITPGLSRQRPDIRLVGGGLVQAPDASTLGHLEELDRSHVMVACAAETIVLALSGFQSRNLCGQLDVATVDELGRLAEQLGFSVAG